MPAPPLAKDMARVVMAGVEVVQDHVKSCQASLLLAEKHVRQRAVEKHGGIGEAWRYFASPAILDLAKALRRLERVDADG